MNQDRISRRNLIRLGAVAGAGWLTAPRLAAAEAEPLRVGGDFRSNIGGDELQGMLEELVAKHRMPGAVAGVFRNGQVLSAAAGIANLNTGAPMTTEIGFLTGSITKVWAATLVMTFVDDGTIDLDTPLTRYLPNLRFADAEATRTIAVRHLLNHSSGLDAGDFILDLGEGPAAHALFAQAVAKRGQIHRPGAYASYCNGGWVLAGHLLETLTGKSWHKLLAERVIAPMGLTRTFPDAEDGVLYGVAVGSVPDPKRPGEHMATPKFLLPKTFAPAGATLITTVADNLQLARMHIRGGLAENGTRILSEASARAMATRTIDNPSGPASGIGLGWGHSTPGGRTMLAHGGGSNGGRAQLAVIPDAGFAYASFVNSSVSDAFQSELQRRIMATFAAGTTPEVMGTRPVSATIDRSAFVGTYRRATTRATIREEGNKLVLETEWNH